RGIVPADTYIEQSGRDLFFPGPSLEQGEFPSLLAEKDEAVERTVPNAVRVGIIPANAGAGLPAGAIEDIELFQGRSPIVDHPAVRAA
ncbi:MAG: hypothetical protein HGB21_16015, partial [Nitrospirae bacterium]|nr:hypothetical protein [Nitrospirota bacterium]